MSVKNNSRSGGGPFEPYEQALAAADAARDRRDWAGAVRGYTAVIERRPDLGPIWVQLGHAFKELQQFDKAEASYLEAMDRLADDGDLHLQLGHLYKLMDRLADAQRSYEAAASPPHNLLDAKRELLALVKAPPSSSVLRRSPMAAPASEPSVDHSVGLTLAFDCTDLVNYLMDHANPSGIQRVQLALYDAALKSEAKVAKSFVFFTPRVSGWILVPTPYVALLCALASSDVQSDRKEWGRLISDFKELIATAGEFVFEPGAVLINLGSSWAMQDYLLHVRNLRLYQGVRYVPFIHDCIPALIPEHCEESNAANFNAWLADVYEHIPLALANSESTARDFGRIAEQTGATSPPVIVMPLSGELPGSARKVNVQAILDRLGLTAGEYVLYVSTLESRKNHVMLFQAWLTLLRLRGRQTPRLVCVGREGWLFDAARAKLDANPDLKNSVLLLSDVSDPALRALYDGALFTVYPSIYEGWGLPVTESLCAGKVPVVADNSSLREAGGEHALYFETGSQAALTAHCRRLIEDEAYRNGLEATLRRTFQPRQWSDIYAEMERELVQRLGGACQGGDKAWAPRAVAGAHYMMARLGDKQDELRRAGAILRIGANWYEPEDWGCWVRPGRAQIRFRAEGLGRSLVYLGLAGLPNASTDVEIAIGSKSRRYALQAGQRRWVSITADLSPGETTLVAFECRSKFPLADITNGADQRVVAFGLLGMMVCASNDYGARLDFLERVVSEQ